MSNHILRTNHILRQWCLLAFLLVPGIGALAAVDVREFDNETDRARYQSFIDELRCPKCQNQNLAGSDAPIAKDLRDQVYRLIEEGRSDKEIVDFMVERYGDSISSAAHPFDAGIVGRATGGADHRCDHSDLGGPSASCRRPLQSRGGAE